MPLPFKLPSSLRLDPARRSLVAAIIMFMASASVAGLLVLQSEQQRLRELRIHLAEMAGDHAQVIQRNIERALSATYALAALVRQGNGNVPDFEASAREMLPYYPGVASLQLAPGGIVQRIVPLAGNEKAIGHNLLQDPARDKEAFLARDTGKLTLAGPFDLIQGGLGAVGRLPVFLEDRMGNRSFWGFTIVLIRFPESIEDARLSRLEELGFAYELWRIHPDTGERQIIASSIAELSDPVGHVFDMPNGVWTLSIEPVEGWGDTLGLTLKIAMGLLFSLLLAYLLKLLADLRIHKQNLEVLVEQRTQQLSSSERRYRGMFENSADAILLISLDGYIRDANPEACRVYGYEHDEFIGKHGSEFVHPEHAWKFANALATILHSGQNYAVESMDVRKDGTPFPTDVHISPFNHLGEEVMLCSIRDITERKKLEEQLHDQQLHLANLVQQRTAELSEALEQIQEITSQVPGLVYQLQMCPDGSFCVPYASSAINDIFRLSPDDVCEDASRIFAHVHPSDSPGLLASIHASARDMAPWHYEFRTKFDDGSERWLLGDALPQWKEDGSVLWHGFITDVTERKQAAAALQRSEQHFLAVAQSANDAIITAGSDGRILGWNASAERMFGYQGSEILGRELTMLMPQRFRARHTAGLARVADGGATRMMGKTVELVGLREDGGEFPLEISLAQYRSGEGWYCSAIIRDITERKQAEQRLSELSAHLQNVREEEKARIAREIHDDLGGTLTALKMNTHWLDEELSAIEETAVLVDYVKSMSQLLDEAVLATRRIITDLRPTILDDLGLLAAIEWHAESFYKRTGIVCYVNCVENAGKVDQQRSIALFRIFQEALTNVARHSGASTVEVEYHHDGREIFLSVSDNGRGMPEEQAIASTSYGIRGMRERIEQLGGEIRFACPPTGGLSLIVNLPVPDSHPPEEVQA